MGYTEDSSRVEATFFKTSGKYYTTEVLDMSAVYYYPNTPIDAVIEALRREGNRLPEMICVVLKPYHNLSYPVMILPECRDFSGVFEQIADK